MSKALMGSKHALDVRVLIALADPPVAYPRELALALRIGDNQVVPELEKLARAGALTELEADGEARRYFQRLDHPIWDICCQIVVRELRLAPHDAGSDELVREYWRHVYGAPLPQEAQTDTAK